MFFWHLDLLIGSNESHRGRTGSYPQTPGTDACPTFAPFTFPAPSANHTSLRLGQLNLARQSHRITLNQTYFHGEPTGCCLLKIERHRLRGCGANRVTEVAVCFIVADQKLLKLSANAPMLSLPNVSTRQYQTAPS